MAKIIRLCALADGWRDVGGDVERLASPVGQMATMLVGLIDDGVRREEAIARAVRWLLDAHEEAGTVSLAEIEAAEWRYANALEIALEILDVRPQSMKELARCAFIRNIDDLKSGAARAKCPMPLRIPRTMKALTCVALDGARPGFAFFPGVEPGEYALQVGTPGVWRFALLVVGSLDLCSADSPTSAGLVEEFTIRVSDGAGVLPFS